MKSAGKGVGAAVVAVLLALGMVIVAISGFAAALPPGCGAAGTATGFRAGTLDAEQMGNAGTIVNTTATYAGGSLPAYAAAVAVAAADTESGLRNVPGGDRDSAGLFQIRTRLHGTDVATDPVKSTTWFLDALVRVPNWQTIPLTEAAADVERPALAYRDRYAGAQALGTAVVAQLWPTARATSTSTSTSGGTSTAGPSRPDSVRDVEAADVGLCPTSGSGRRGGTSTAAMACTIGGAGTVESGPGNVPIRVCDAGRGVIADVTIAPQVAAMMAAADTAGLHLTGGGFRSYAQQVQLRNAHCGTSDYAVYQKPSNQCSPPTAIPGTSMHEWGLAVDWSSNGSLVSSPGSAGWQWLRADASRFGFSNLPSEPWHWSSNGH